MPTTPPAATSLWHRLRQGQLGAGWMIVASLLFALMGLFVKLGSAHFSAIELVFYRTFVGMLGIAGVVLVRRQSLADLRRILAGEVLGPPRDHFPIAAHAGPSSGCGRASVAVMCSLAICTTHFQSPHRARLLRAR